MNSQLRVARPTSLRRGSRVAIVAPSRPVMPEAVTTALTTLTHWGLETTLQWLVPGSRGYLAGPDDATRAAMITGALTDPTVDAVWCARGGYGAGRLLSLIDWEAIRKADRPVIVTGFSDITALHLGIAHELGWVTFHGPVAALLGEDGPSMTRDEIHRAWTDPTPRGVLPVPDTTTGWEATAVAVRPGRASGRVIGGNLALVCSLIGTPWAMRAADSLVVLEDVGEAPYRMDRMLVQLRASGGLSGCRGIIFGSSPTCERGSDNRPSLTLMEVLADLLGDLGVPIIYGWPIGHTPHQWTLPFGVVASMDTHALTLTIDESATNAQGDI